MNNNQMTERERILSVLNHKQPDRLPWCADFAYYIHGLEQDNKYPKEYINNYLDDGLQKMHRDYGTGFYLQGFQPYSSINNNVEVKRTQVGDTVTTVIKTPVGELTEVQKYGKQSYSWGITKHMVEDIDDLKVYAYYMENTVFSADYEYAKNRYKTIGDNGVVLCYTPKSPLMDLIAIYAGVENLTYMIMDDDDEFDEIIKSIEQKHDEACQLVVDSPAECIMIPENISSECVVPFYDKYMKNYHQKWTSKIREAGKYSFVHQDGTVKGLISQLSKESHFDVIEAVTPLPMGDIAIEEVRSYVDDKTIIWGGIPGGMFDKSTMGEEEFVEHVKKCIDVMTQTPNFVLGVADQVVPNSDVDRIKKVRELVNEFGFYK